MRVEQRLGIQRFFGTSENAVKMQRWIAVSVYLLVAIIKKWLHLDASLHTLLQITHVERKSLFATIAKLPRSTATATHRATVRRLTPLRDHVHTITYDNGKEFAGHRHTAHRLQAHIFFATPYHAWERGVNENTNGLIRDFFPKGTDFTTIHPATVAKVERLLNRRPRKSLGFQTPNEVFHALTRGG